MSNDDNKTPDLSGDHGQSVDGRLSEIKEAGAQRFAEAMRRRALRKKADQDDGVDERELSLTRRRKGRDFDLGR